MTEPPRAFYELLPPGSRDRLDAASRVVRYRRGSILFREGDSASSVVVVLSGQLKLTKLSLDGRQVILDLRGRGDLLGDMAVFDSGTRSATATFVTDGRTLQLSAAEFARIVEQDAHIAGAVIRTFVARLRDASFRQLEFGASDAHGRVCRRLVELADRYGERGENGVVNVISPLSQHELAEWCGLSRDAVVKVLASLRARGWLETGRKRFGLVDLAALRERALADI